MRLGPILALLAACDAGPLPVGDAAVADGGGGDGGAAALDAARTGAAVVATANLRCLIDDWDARLPVLVDELDRLGPDVIALQEVCRDPQAARDGLLELLAALRGQYHEVRADTHLAWDRYQEGIAVLARGEVLSSSVVELPAGAFPRRAIVVRVAAPTGPLVFAGTHLSFGEERAATRVEQLAAVRAAVEVAREPCDTAVIAGDFNESPDGAAVGAALAGGYADAWAVAHPGEPGPTVPSDAPSARIDYVLVAPGNAAVGDAGRFLDAARDGVFASDHLGVWSELHSHSCPTDS